jgi:hypothetical protein
MSRHPAFISEAGIIGALAGLFQKVKCQRPRLADLNFDTMAGLEPGTLQPLSSETDFRLDVPTPKIPATFDLQTTRAHFRSPSLLGNRFDDARRISPAATTAAHSGDSLPNNGSHDAWPNFCADSTQTIKTAAGSLLF